MKSIFMLLFFLFISWFVCTCYQAHIYTRISLYVCGFLIKKKLYHTHENTNFHEILPQNIREEQLNVDKATMSWLQKNGTRIWSDTFNYRRYCNEWVEILPKRYSKLRLSNGEWRGNENAQYIKHKVFCVQWIELFFKIISNILLGN